MYTFTKLHDRHILLTAISGLLIAVSKVHWHPQFHDFIAETLPLFTSNEWFHQQYDTFPHVSHKNNKLLTLYLQGAQKTIDYFSQKRTLQCHVQLCQTLADFQVAHLEACQHAIQTPPPSITAPTCEWNIWYISNSQLENDLVMYHHVYVHPQQQTVAESALSCSI